MVIENVAGQKQSSEEFEGLITLNFFRFVAKLEFLRY